MIDALNQPSSPLPPPAGGEDLGEGGEKSQSGNMLIYILGAIFLLGLLVVITKGNFQPGAGIDQEAVIMKVSEVRRYASELERGVNYIMQNGASETDIRFSHPNAASAYGTYDTTPRAEVFNPQGGGVEWKDPPEGVQVTATPWVFNGRNNVMGVGSTCNATQCSDLIAVLPDVTKDFCLAVNNSAGITNPSGAPPKEITSFYYLAPFAGAYGYTNNLDTIGDYTLTKLDGCLEGNTGDAVAGKYYYYKVLLAR